MVVYKISIYYKLCVSSFSERGKLFWLSLKQLQGINSMLYSNTIIQYLKITLLPISTSNNTSFQHPAVTLHRGKTIYHSFRTNAYSWSKWTQKETQSVYLKENPIYPNLQLTRSQNPIREKKNTSTITCEANLTEHKRDERRCDKRTTSVICKRTLKAHDLLLSQIHDW